MKKWSTEEETILKSTLQYVFIGTSKVATDLEVQMLCLSNMNIKTQCK